MERPSFIRQQKPIICAMVKGNTPDEYIKKIKSSIACGAEAIGAQLCRLKREYRSHAELRRIFDACEGLPIYVTSYRLNESEGLTDEECAELLLAALDAGATMPDVMGDMFGRSPQYELAEAPEAIARQKELIAEIHRRGGEVLMSSHTYKSTTLEENLMIARAQAERGADIVKIVNRAENVDEIPKYAEAIRRILKLPEMQEKKLLFLVSGSGQLIRYIGANLGVCMYLCVDEHGPMDTAEQPTIAQIRAIRDNIIFDR